MAMLVLDFDGVCTLSSSELQTYARAPALHEVVRPGARQAVATAKERNITTVVLSNELDAAWVEEVPLLAEVDHVIICSENGILKPDRRAFQRCALLGGHEPQQVLVVDDQADNITVAESLGMATLLFDISAPAASWELVDAHLRGEN